jgi:hypothetical protein
MARYYTYGTVKVPGKHDTGPIVSKYGLRVGDKNSSVEVIDENGAIALSDAVDTAQLADDAVTTAKIDDDAVTTAKIDDDAVTAAKLDAGALWSAIMDSGLGYGADYASNSSGNDTLVADPTATCDVTIVVTVTEEFTDDGEDSQPLFTIGVDMGDDIDSIMDNTVLTDAAVGYQYVWTGTIDSGDIINVGATAAAESATGAINVLALVKEQ